MKLAAITLSFLALTLISCEPDRPVVPPSKGPPAGAEFITMDPAAIIMDVASKKGDASDYIGKWNDERGWDGELMSITNENTGTALRISNSEARLAGGTYWIVAVVGDNPDVETRKLVRVQGRIKDVSSKAMTGANIVHRILLEDARIIK